LVVGCEAKVAGSEWLIVASLALVTGMWLPAGTCTVFTAREEPGPVSLEVVGVAGAHRGVVASLILATRVVVVLSADATAHGRSPVKSVVVAMKIIITLIARRVTARLSKSPHLRCPHSESRTGALNVGRNSAADRSLAVVGAKEVVLTRARVPSIQLLVARS